MKKLLFTLTLIIAASMGQLNAKVPVIGISSYNSTDASMADLTYIECVKKAGAIPVAIPVLSDSVQIEQVMSMLDGIIMTGGGDFDPLRWYGEQPRREMTIIQYERDDYDIMMARAAIAKGVPVLGICRGEQLLAVAFGGALWQDIPSQVEGNVKHNQMPTNPKYPTHSIYIEKGSILAKLLGKEEVRVNSLHHQGIKRMPEGLKAIAHSADGVVEAVERAGRIKGYKDAGGWILGLQFHPEILVANGGNNTFLPIFETFVNEARKYSAGK